MERGNVTPTKKMKKIGLYAKKNAGGSAYCNYRIWDYLLLWGLLFSAVFFTFECIASLLDAEFQAATLRWLMVGITAFEIGFYTWKSKGKWIALALFGVFSGIYIWKMFDALLDGFWYVAGSGIRLVNDCYGTNFSYEYGMETEELQAATAFLCVIVVLLSAIFYLTLICRKCILIALLVEILGVSFCLAVGMMAEPVYWIGEIAVIAATIVLESLSKLSRKSGSFTQEERSGLYSAMAGLILTAVLMTVGYTLVTEDYYREKLFDEEDKERLENFAMEVATGEWADSVVEKAENVYDWAKELIAGTNLDGLVGDVDNLPMFDDFGDLDLHGMNLTGGLNNGDFNFDAAVEYAEGTALTLLIPETAHDIYLKGYVGSVYTPNGWKEFDSRTIREANLISDGVINSQMQVQRTLEQIANENLKIDRGVYITSVLNGDQPTFIGDFTVKYQDASKNYLYAPYFLRDSSVFHADRDGDAYYTVGSRRTEYTASYLDIDNERLFWLSEQMLQNRSKLSSNNARSTRLITFDDEYGKFAKKYYTQMPAGHEGLKALHLVGEDATVEQKVSAVMDYLQTNCTYTLAPGEVPAGEDYIDYFVLDSHKGYCVHFASAAVLLLRNLGVPARYVEGYYVPQSDIASGTYMGMQEVVTWAPGKDYASKVRHTNESVVQRQVEVKNARGHAWVEVYLDFVGWVPVEATSSYGTGSGAASVEDIIAGLPIAGVEEFLNGMKPTATPSPAPTNSTEPTSGAKPTTAPTQQERPTGAPVGQDNLLTPKPEENTGTGIPPSVLDNLPEEWVNNIPQEWLENIPEDVLEKYAGLFGIISGIQGGSQNGPGQNGQPGEDSNVTGGQQENGNGEVGGQQGNGESGVQSGIASENSGESDSSSGENGQNGHENLDEGALNSDGAGTDSETGESTATSGVHWLVRGILLLLLATALLVLRYRLTLWYRNNCGRTLRAEVLWHYRRSNIILKKMALEKENSETYEDFAVRVERAFEQRFETELSFSSCQRIALQAGFGENSPNEEESAAVKDCYEIVRTELYKTVNKLSAFAYKYLVIY